MASSTAPTVDSNGISAPQFADILAYLQAEYKAIFGQDVYLGNDSQDGQFLGIVAAAINDSNAAAIAVYNAFSPATAQGNGLSSVVKINGIARLVASNSTVDLTIVGTAGTTIVNGQATDTNNTNTWNLPITVTIPPSGTVTVTATASVAGAIAAAPNTITKIKTPTFGWQTVNNATAASTGSPVESDAALRVRQSSSVALPSLTVLGGIVGAVETITGVTDVAAYENDTDATDTNGLPPHSISLVVNGGDVTQIATAIMQKKTPGAYTHGTTLEVVQDQIGIYHNIRFFRPTPVDIEVEITLEARAGYSTAVSQQIKEAVATYISDLLIGQNVVITRLYVPAQLGGTGDAATFEIVTLEAAIVGGTLGTTDIAVGFNGLAVCSADNVTVTVV